MLRVLKDSTDTVISYPRLIADGFIATGLPVSCTAKRVTPTSADTSFQSATVDSLSTTVQGTQQIGAESITLAGSVSIIAGRKYQIVDASHGRTTIVEATNTGSSTTLYLREPLEEHISNGSTVKGLACTIALTAAQTAIVGAGFIYFRATVDGIVREWDEAIRIVSRITSVQLTPIELTQAYPIVRSIASSTDLTLEESIRASWNHLIVPLLSAKQILDEDILTDDILVPLHAAATALHLARQWASAPSEFVKRLEDNYELIKQTTFDRIDLLTAPQDEIAPIPQPEDQSPRFLRLVR